MAAQRHRDVTFFAVENFHVKACSGVFDSFTAYASGSYRYWKRKMNKFTLNFLIEYIDVRIEMYYLAR